MATGDPLHTGDAAAGLCGYDLHEGVACSSGNTTQLTRMAGYPGGRK